MKKLHIDKEEVMNILDILLYQRQTYTLTINSTYNLKL